MRAAVAGLIAATACGRIGFDTTAHSVLSLDRVDPGEPLDAFPLLVVLDDTRLDRSVMQSDASDLRFVDTQGTVLPVEIEQLGAVGGDPLLAWVQVPAIIGTTTVLTVSYGSAEPPAAATSAVWDASYIAVYHFADAGPKVHDSTGNGHVATSTGSIAAPGIVGRGRAFIASDEDSMQIDDAPDLGPTARTLSGWMYENEVPLSNLYHAMISRQIGTTGTDEAYLGDHDGTLFTNYVSSTGSYLVNGPAAMPGQWVHMAMTADSAAATLYINGVQSRQVAVAGAPMHPASPILLGADANTSTSADDDWLDGAIDELRIEAVVRSPAWIAYTVAVTHDHAISYGSIERP